MRLLPLTPYPVTLSCSIGNEEWLHHIPHLGTQDLTWLPDNNEATTHAVEGGNKIHVTLREEVKPGVLVHEAVHVTQGVWDFIEEDHPGAEANAYLTQHIFNWLTEQVCSFHQSHQEPSSSSEELSPSAPSTSTSDTSSPPSEV